MDDHFETSYGFAPREHPDFEGRVFYSGELATRNRSGLEAQREWLELRFREPE